MSRIIKTRAGFMGYDYGSLGIEKVYLPQPTKESLMEKYGIDESSTSGLRLFDDKLADYFKGIESDFKDVPQNMEGLTAFQQRVLEKTRDVPYGQTKSYGWIARSIGAPYAARAVGNALRSNPLPLLVPCHRIVGSTGLGGFTPSIDLKKRLLKLEGAL